jgi:dihydropteroate synthase
MTERPFPGTAAPEMDVRPAGALWLGRGRFEPEQLLVMAVVPRMAWDPAVAMERVHEAVAEGADIVGVAGGPGGEVGSREEIRRVVPFIATVRDAYPELVIGVSTGRDEVAREACAAGADLLNDVLNGQLLGVAAEFGAGVVCSLALAARAVEAGVEPERVIIGAEGSGQVTDLVATGWPVLVSLLDEDLARDPAGDPAGELARAAVFGWLGARVFGVRRVRETRRVLSMVSAIRGDVPPAHAVRGLA